MSERDQIRNFYGDKCYLCGQLLGKSFHVDHLLPIRRITQWDETLGRFVEKGVSYPERDVISNKKPCCASCNILKGASSLEEFREKIKSTLQSLNQTNTQYKLAKRYNLLKETDEKVVFYFEKM